MWTNYSLYLCVGSSDIALFSSHGTSLISDDFWELQSVMTIETPGVIFWLCSEVVFFGIGLTKNIKYTNTNMYKTIPMV